MGIVGAEFGKKLSGFAVGELAFFFYASKSVLRDLDNHAATVGFVGLASHPVFSFKIAQDVCNARRRDPGTVGNLGRAELSVCKHERAHDGHLARDGIAHARRHEPVHRAEFADKLPCELFVFVCHVNSLTLETITGDNNTPTAF